MAGSAIWPEAASFDLILRVKGALRPPDFTLDPQNQIGHAPPISLASLWT
jgi:hypothetical protein